MRWLAWTLLLAAKVAIARPIDDCPPSRDPDPGTFGVAPDSTSLLGPASAAWSMAAQQLHDTTDHALPGDWLALQRADIQGHVGPGLGFGAAWSRVSSADPDLRTRGNLTVDAGYRATTLWLGGAVRAGAALQLAQGFATGGSESALQQAKLQRLAGRLAFHEADVAPGRPFAAVLEGRIEMVGCHVPFVHLRLGIERWRAANAPAANAFPLSVTVGGYQRTWLGLAMVIAVDLRTPHSVFAAQRLTKVSALVDFRICRFFHVAVHGDAISGAATGVEIGAAVATTFEGGS